MRARSPATRVGRGVARATAAIASLAVLLVAAAPASAAIVFVDPKAIRSPELVFLADPGEANAIAITASGSSATVVDTAVPTIVADPPCQAPANARRGAAAVHCPGPLAAVR